MFFFFNDTATTEIYTLSLHDALPISRRHVHRVGERKTQRRGRRGRLRHERRGAEPCDRSEEHTSELQSRLHLVCRLLLEKKKKKKKITTTLKATHQQSCTQYTDYDSS